MSFIVYAHLELEINTEPNTVPMNISPHTFHIPVMGTAFTIDTPVKVAQYGISSVISLGDDMLLERLRKMYCKKFDLPYTEINDKAQDSRARRITSYLNLIKKLVEKNFMDLKNAGLQANDGIKKYLQLLPDGSALRKQLQEVISGDISIQKLSKWFSDHLSPGSIDVNIMTKLDKPNYKNGEQRPIEFNDAHAALRGFARSDLSSSIVFSAGMNPRLYSYMEQFEDFFPDQNSQLKKKIILKVSDYRSALIQGRFLAKKGLWVSEFRIESGLNCGGHAFATNGHLMGPILAQFRDQRKELYEILMDEATKSWIQKKYSIPGERLPFKISAQGGVGTAEEHHFLLDHYQLDSVGWGTPFLLVPEVTNVDQETRNMLVKATEKDLYLSGISPLGVPFNSLRGNTRDADKLKNIRKYRPGSSCPKKFLSSNTEFTDEPICTASRQYQNLKLKELDTLDLNEEAYQVQRSGILEKSCICVGLGNSALVVNDLHTRKDGFGISICPGPNMAYYSKEFTLEDLVDHIYGRKNVITRTDRPHMFIKELDMYLDYIRKELRDSGRHINHRQLKNLREFSENLKSGIIYYQELFSRLKKIFQATKDQILDELNGQMEQLRLIEQNLESKTMEPV